MKGEATAEKEPSVRELFGLPEEPRHDLAEEASAEPVLDEIMVSSSSDEAPMASASSSAVDPGSYMGKHAETKATKSRAPPPNQSSSGAPWHRFFIFSAKVHLL